MHDLTGEDACADSWHIGILQPWTLQKPKENRQMKLNVLTVTYDTDINDREVPLFRGAVIASVDAGAESGTLFHNHEGDGFHYSYPLIQYKCIGHRPMLVGVQEGALAVWEYLQTDPPELTLNGRRVVHVRQERVDASELEFTVTDGMVNTYTLHRWLALNSSNYAAYAEAKGLVEKVQRLERILTGNILSMASGLGVFVDVPINVQITDICGKPRVVNYKKVGMMAFDIEFRSNVILPDFIGLGKGNSRGFGIVRNKKH